MIIHYCDTCGVRIAPAEVESGAARVSEEGKAICAKCAPARRGSTRVAVGAAPRDSRLGLAPARRDSKIKIQPAAPSTPGPATVLPTDTPKAPAGKRKFLPIGGAVATIAIVVVLVVSLRGPKPDTPQETACEDPARISAPGDVDDKTAPALPPVLPQPHPQDQASANPQPPADGVKEQPAAYDPRAEVAQSILEQAKASFKNAPSDPWTYQDKLQKLINDHPQTPAGKEAATILAALNPGPRPADPSLPPEDAWKAARDLLELADPAKHTVSGTWTKENGVLLSSKEGRTKLALPYVLPDEYDIKLVLTRVDGRNNFCLNVAHMGKPLTFHLAGWGNKMAGWEMLENKRLDTISTNLQRNNMLENNKRYTLILQMRKTRWAAFLDGQSLVKRDRDVNRSISQYKDLKLPNPLQFGLITVDSAYRLDELKVLEVTGTGKVLTDVEVADASKPPIESPPTPTEKPPAVTPPQPNASAYAVWLTTYMHHWGNQDWVAARNCVEGALKNPDLAAKTADLNLDRECLALVELAQQAIPKGAELLKDGRAFTLEETKGKKHIVGHKTKVLSADDKGIKIQEDIGGGQITLDLWMSSLTPETLLELARIGLPEDGRGKLALVLYRFPYTFKALTPDAQRFFDALLNQAEKAQAPADLLERLHTWQGLLDREKSAEKAFQSIEPLVAGKKGPEARAAFDDLGKSFADTAFVEESREKLAALQTRIAPLLLQPGLIAKYYSGDEKNKRKTFHSSQVVKGLDYNWGDKSPMDGVPADYFLIEFTGALRVEEAGEYIFSWWGDDGTEVWIDGKGYGKNKDKNNQHAVLQAGDHPLKVVFTENTGNASMWVKWKPPSEKNGKKIPTENLVHNPADLETPK